MSVAKLGKGEKNSKSESLIKEALQLIFHRKINHFIKIC